MTMFTVVARVTVSVAREQVLALPSSAVIWRLLKPIHRMSGEAQRRNRLTPHDFLLSLYPLFYKCRQEDTSNRYFNSLNAQSISSEAVSLITIKMILTRFK